MPNDPSYVVFSEIIEAESKEDHQLLVRAATRLWGTDGEQVEEWPGPVLELLPISFDEIYGNMPNWRALKMSKGIIVYSSDGCSMHAVTPLVQRYLIKRHPDWYWWTEWAEICEKPKPGGFRGGAVMVTADKVRWHFTTRWVNNMIERVELEL